jgi:uncharacterized protein
MKQQDTFTKLDVLARLKENEPSLRAHGVHHVALFGSRARGDDHSQSDIDLLVDLAPEAELSLFEYVRLKDYIASLFVAKTDVVNLRHLKSHIKYPATSEAIYAF